jgi:hypothetical protein
MKKMLVFITVWVLSILLFVKCDNKKTETTDLPAAVENYGGFGSQIKWGEHLVIIAGCHDCHSPKKGYELDSAHLLAGYIGAPVVDVSRKEVQGKGWVVTSDQTSWVGPWGITYSSNITSDSTGIGNWKEEQFIYAFQKGKYGGLETGRKIMPPMPLAMYVHMTDEELKAIFAYLKSTKPIKNAVPVPVPPVSM